MKYDDFISALIDAGWQATNDAQYVGIEALWRKLFPVVAELEDKLFDLECMIEDM